MSTVTALVILVVWVSFLGAADPSPIATAAAETSTIAAAAALPSTYLTRCKRQYGSNNCATAQNCSAAVPGCLLCHHGYTWSMGGSGSQPVLPGSAAVRSLICDFCTAGHELIDIRGRIVTPIGSRGVSAPLRSDNMQPQSFYGLQKPQCRPCPIGWYSKAGSKCEKCPTGLSTTGAGSAACQVVPVGPTLNIGLQGPATELSAISEKTLPQLTQTIARVISDVTKVQVAPADIRATLVSIARSRRMGAPAVQPQFSPHLIIGALIATTRITEQILKNQAISAGLAQALVADGIIPGEAPVFVGTCLGECPEIEGEGFITPVVKRSCGIDVCIVLDESGSMTEKAYDVEVELATSLLTSIAGDSSRIAVYSFSGSGEQTNLLGEKAYLLRPELSPAVTSQIRSHRYTPGSGTDIGGAIAKCSKALADMLSPDGKDEGSQARSTKGREQYIVLATDGAPSGTQEIDPESAAKAANALGQSLVTIGIGDAVNKELLELIGDRYSLMVESVMDATRSTNLIADELCKGAPNPNAPVDSYLLSAGRRYHDCRETLKGVPTINENMATIQYNIEVTTAPLAMAGTGGDVKVVLHGEKGSTDELLLNSFLYDDFEPGATNTFQVDAMDVGRVMYMTVRLSKDPNNPLPAQDWALSFVKVTKDADPQIPYTFTYDKWVPVDTCVKLVELSVLYEAKKEVMADVDNFLQKRFMTAGPFVRYSGSEGYTWSGSVLFVTAEDTPNAAKLTMTSTTSEKPTTGELIHQYIALTADDSTKRYVNFWRFPLKAKMSRLENTKVTYSVTYKGSPYSGVIHLPIPGAFDSWRFAHGSCNSYDPTVAEHFHDYPKGEAPTWETLMAQHEQNPFSLLHLGGDQLYMDFLAFQIPSFHPTLFDCWEVIHGDRSDFWAKLPATKDSQRQLENSVLRHYIRVFGDGPMSAALRNIPTVMMWDDHDINDGWGSYSPKLQKSPIFQQWYAATRKFFMLFQQHAAPDSTAAQLRDLGFLAATSSSAVPLSQLVPMGSSALMLILDMRSERTLKQMMSPAHLEILQEQVEARIAARFTGNEDIKHLLVMTGVPFIYPSFLVDRVPAFVRQKVMLAAAGDVYGTFEQNDLEDDMADGWIYSSARGNHLKERDAFITWLQKVSDKYNVRVSTFAGDSHMASLGSFSSSKPGLDRTCDHRFMISAVSSPIGVSPAAQALVDAMSMLGNTAASWIGLAKPDAETAVSLLPVFPQRDGSKRDSMMFYNGRHFMTVEKKERDAEALHLEWTLEKHLKDPSAPIEVLTVQKTIPRLEYQAVRDVCGTD